MKQLSLEEKQAIQAQLQAYVAKYPSQNKAVNSLTGTSAGTVNAVLNGKFDNISDEMLLRIRSQVAPAGTADWTLCETTAFRELTLLLEDAQQNRSVACRFTDRDGCIASDRGSRSEKLPYNYSPY